MNKLGWALLFTLPLTAACLSARTAASAAETWKLSGTDFSNIFPFEDTPVTVERERITAQIPALSLPGDKDAKNSFICAEYTLFNPSDKDETVRVGFPCGSAPDYADANFYDENPCTVEVGGKETKPSLMHSYAGGDFSQTVAQIRTQNRESFYSPDLPVTQSIFHIRAEEEGWTWLVLHCDCSPRTTRIVCSEKCDMRIDNGMGKISYGFDAGKTPDVTLMVYTIGDAVSWEGEKLVSGTDKSEGRGIIVKQSQTMSFFSLAMQNYPSDSAISEQDWYNGFVDMLEQNTVNEYMVTATPSACRQDRFMRWFKYSIEIPAGQRAVTSVTAPLFPAVHGDGSGSVYSYSVLLSPAVFWSGFGAIEIKIVTQYHLSESSLTFEEGDGEYRFTREKLPQGELNFSLVRETASPPEYRPYAPADGLALYIVLGVCGGVAAVTVIVLAAVTLRRKRRRAEEERRLQQTRVQEGTVDLPDRKEE